MIEKVGEQNYSVFDIKKNGTNTSFGDNSFFSGNDVFSFC